MGRLSFTEAPKHLWLDYSDADQKISSFLKSGEISEDEASTLIDFKENGYIILTNAAKESDIDGLNDDLNKLYLDKEKYLLRMPKGEVIHPTHSVNPPKSRLLDLYVNNEHARNIALSTKIQRILHLIFQEPGLLFQSLIFTWGTEHSIHTDHSYIVCEPACSLISCWFALEDIVPGSGELVFFPKSHKLPIVAFENGRIQWRHNVDGKLKHQEYTTMLEERAQKIGNEVRFIAKKGDVIIWHPNLVHYGSDISLANQTRKSFLASYCPANTGKPNYFNFFEKSFKRPWGDAYFSSRRYDLTQPEIDPYPVYMR